MNMLSQTSAKAVALLAEGVGRNDLGGQTDIILRVALLAEGVGRNIVLCLYGIAQAGSPSSRRAWVEIWR